MQKVKEVWWDECQLDVSGTMVEFRVEGVFSCITGRYEVRRRRTTNQVSMNDEANDLIIQRLNEMEKSMISKMKTLRDDFAEKQGSDDELLKKNFPNTENEQDSWAETGRITGMYSSKSGDDDEGGERAGDDENGQFGMSLNEDTGEMEAVPEPAKKKKSKVG